MHMNDFKISWVAWLGSLTKPSKVERPALRPGHLGTTVASLLRPLFLATRQNGHKFSCKKNPG